ncbi:MAG: hypothetical protein WCR55_14370 [Lentisphaerota bacterium]
MEKKKPKIILAKESISDFIKENISQEFKIIQIKKTDEGWLGEFEMFEDSAFIKALGLPAKVKDRNLYEIKLTDELEVVSYVLKKLNAEE